MAKTDKKTLELIKEVQRRKEEIAKAEKPAWKTNCSFSYNEGSATLPINLQVESNIKTLVNIAAFLRDKEDSYVDMAQELGVIDAPEFTWNGSPVADWISDIKSRINKVQIANKKKQLETLETRLAAIVSPELRAELELEAISQALGA